MTELIIGLGSNLGDRRANLEEAVRQLSQLFGPPLAVSTFIETEPWGYQSENSFLNGVVVFGVEMVELVEKVEEVEMVELLKKVQKVEMEMGRIRKPGGYTDRIIDLDILFFGDYVYSSPDLTIPHPHIFERDFVKIPLAEIRPGLFKRK